jgi:peptidoglycan/LPS O-acetylase OafA/YrhL
LTLLTAGMCLTVLRPTIVGDFLLGGGFAALLAAVLSSAECVGRLGGLLAFRPLVGVGAISYSLYLTHSLAIEWTVNTFRPHLRTTSSMADAVLLVAALAAVAALGLAFYLGIEQRFVRSVDAAPSDRGPQEIVTPAQPQLGRAALACGAAARSHGTAQPNLRESARP